MPEIINPSGGGGSQTTTVANDTIWDAKGDQVVATGADAAARVAIGSPGDVWKATGSSTTAAWGKPRGYYKMPASAIAETVMRESCANNAAPTTAQLYLMAIELEAGMVVANFNLRTNTVALSSGTNQWMSLHDSSRVQLAASADQALANMAASTEFHWPVATIASGAAASYTVPSTGLYYVGLMLKAGTMCSIADATLGSGAQGAPILAGSANAAQTGPNAFPFTASALTALATYWHLWVS